MPMGNGSRPEHASVADADADSLAAEEDAVVGLAGAPEELDDDDDPELQAAIANIAVPVIPVRINVRNVFTCTPFSLFDATSYPDGN